MEACDNRGGKVNLKMNFSSVIYKNEGNKGDGTRGCKMSIFKGIMTESCSEYIAYLE